MGLWDGTTSDEMPPRFSCIAGHCRRPDESDRYWHSHDRGGLSYATHVEQRRPSWIEQKVLPSRYGHPEEEECRHLCSGATQGDIGFARPKDALEERVYKGNPHLFCNREVPIHEMVGQAKDRSVGHPSVEGKGW